ncbi:GT2 family glycosyltransferase [Paenibacillus intestini]|nr:GT2 family glycosyltransferase [Paenibacillus intestini]
MQDKKQGMIDQVLEIINTLNEVAVHLKDCASKRDYVQLETVSLGIKSVVESIIPTLHILKVEIPHISGTISCENLLYSIENILKLARTRSERLIGKIEFELIPILQDFYYDFYYFTSIFGNKEKEILHYKDEFVKLTANHYIDKSLETGVFKYKVSIAVIAYNKLEYTQQCIQSVLKYTPNYIDYELVLINNGSTDGTSEFFESLSPSKIFTLKENSLNIVAGAINRIFEGEYLLVISNDVIVTEGYLDNLISCIQSDPTIAMVVPTTPNVSNFQTIPAQYSTLEEMHLFAKQNNKSDSARWEERTRLVNPLTFYRSDVALSSQGVGGHDKYFVYGEFSDDSLAIRLRHAGYKMILAKDCYCHHFGSVTLKEAQVKDNTLEKSRNLFIERHGIDAWSTGFCYDDTFIQSLNIKLSEHINILGINSGFGSSPLKIKNVYKEAGLKSINLCYWIEDKRYESDLRTFTEQVIVVEKDIIDTTNDIVYDYILLESNIERIMSKPQSLKKIKSMLADDGIFAVCATNDQEVRLLNELDPSNVITGIVGRWYCWSK